MRFILSLVHEHLIVEFLLVIVKEWPNMHLEERKYEKLTK